MTHWPTRRINCSWRSAAERANTRTRTPGRPSRVRPGGGPSVPASQPQPMTEVAKPVIVRAAIDAQRSLPAVITRRDARMVNASA